MSYEELSDEKYEEMKNTYQSILKKQEENNSLVDELKENELVKRYIDAYQEKEKLESKESYLKKELLIQKILHCSHYYVLNEENSYFDGHRMDTDRVYTCIHCGLTNRYSDNMYRREVYPYSMYNDIIRNHGMWVRGNSHGKYDYEDLDALEEIYQKYKGEYPQASDKDCERHIAMVMKMKKKEGNKLC